MIRKTLVATICVLAAAALTSPSFARSGDHDGQHSQKSQGAKTKESAGDNGNAAKKLKKLPGKKKPATVKLH